MLRHFAIYTNNFASSGISDCEHRRVSQGRLKPDTVAAFDPKSDTRHPYIPSLPLPQMHAHSKHICHRELVLYKHSFKYLSLSHILFLKDPPIA